LGGFGRGGKAGAAVSAVVSTGKGARRLDRHGMVSSFSSLPPALIEPGQWVRNPAQPDWGIGQVQSAIGERITVNFEHIGKILVNIRVVSLEIVESDAP